VGSSAGIAWSLEKREEESEMKGIEKGNLATEEPNLNNLTLPLSAFVRDRLPWCAGLIQFNFFPFCLNPFLKLPFYCATEDEKRQLEART
jgi:hypothetical protein